MPFVKQDQKISEYLLDLVRRQLECSEGEEIDLDSLFNDLADSLDLINIFVEIERHFKPLKFELNPEDLPSDDDLTIRAMIQFVISKLPIQEHVIKVVQSHSRNRPPNWEFDAPLSSFCNTHSIFLISAELEKDFGIPLESDLTENGDLTTEELIASVIRHA